MSWTRSESGLHEEDQGGDKKITQGRETFLHAPLGEKKEKERMARQITQSRHLNSFLHLCTLNMQI